MMDTVINGLSMNAMELWLRENIGPYGPQWQWHSVVTTCPYGIKFNNPADEVAFKLVFGERGRGTS